MAGKTRTSALEPNQKGTARRARTRITALTAAPLGNCAESPTENFEY